MEEGNLVCHMTARDDPEIHRAKSYSMCRIGGWLVDVIDPDPLQESDMQATTTKFSHVCICRVYHFLAELRASPRPVVA